MHKTREAIDIQQEALLDIDSTPFEIFANFHPVEAFNKDSVIFCEYFRKKTGKNLTDKEIETFVDSNRELFELNFHFSVQISMLKNKCISNKRCINTDFGGN